MKKQTLEEKFQPFRERMHKEGLPEIVIDTFKYHYQKLLQGDPGFIREDSIEPVTALPNAQALDPEYTQTGQTVIAKTVMIKLNGGLGTSMGLNRAKSLIEVKNKLNFLDIIAHQASDLQVPLVLMNSYATQADSLSVLEKYPGLLRQDVKLDFLQHKIPKIDRATMAPVYWPEDPELEWCPPGHGDIYTALVTSSMLDELLDAGFNYAFVSNADNLGAILDPAILGYFVKHKFPFLMEAADRLEMDKKGGHLARLPGGKLLLRESAQCHEDDIDSFQDIAKHKYFNTNSLWIDLHALKELLPLRNNILGLSLICNAKTVDPRDKTSPPVYQLETAMGSAISVFENAAAIRVPRSRFVPVKTTDDLAIVRSDVYTLTEDHRLRIASVLEGYLPEVVLDKRYYAMLGDFDRRFSEGVPSLINCQKLLVEGDIRFEGDIVIEGKVNLLNRSGKQVVIKRNTVINSDISWDS